MHTNDKLLNLTKFGMIGLVSEICNVARRA